MKKWIAVIFFAPILGAVIGYLLVYALDNRWFQTKWQVIEKPPGEGLQLIALSGDKLWVQTATGKTYYNEHSSTCKSGCWQEVQRVPMLPVLGPDESTVTGEPCGPSLPLSKVTQRISECRSTLWVDYNFIFALRRDGSIFLWQADIYKEWSVVLLFAGICGGAVLLFILALVFVLFLNLLNRRSNISSR